MRTFAHLILLLALACGVIALYEYFAPNHFHIWFVQQGSYISLSVTFVSLFWKEVDKETKLVSANPVEYVKGCRAVMAGVVRVLADAIHPGAAHMVPRLGLLESAATVGTTLVLLAYLLFWALAVAPMLYFLILVTGAPARSGLTYKGVGALSSGERPEDAASFWAKPVGSTYAVTALLIWGAKSLMGL